MSSRPLSSEPPWSARWPALARAAGITPGERVLLALSGGADSVLLLHWLAAAEPALDFRAVHIDHGLRGEESAADARFCADLARELRVPFRCRRAELDPRGPSLEARARAERYRLLVEEARASGHRTIVTAHHADDALETLLMRWIRGTELLALRGPRAELRWRGAGVRPEDLEDPVRLVRPLLGMRREEVRTLLRARGLAWREDRSNHDPRFTRSRVRHALLPDLLALGGERGLEPLFELGRAIEELGPRLERATAHIRWRPLPHAPACRGPREIGLGGVIEREELAALPPPLARRALWRLLVEGTGAAASRALLVQVLADLHAGRSTRRSLPAGWTLALRPREVQLLPPPRASGPRPALRGSSQQAPRDEALPLSVPGMVALEDGRRITAEVRTAPHGEPPPRGALEVELDAARLAGPLAVRWPAPGDRFWPLGARGSKPLVRFLADRGIPRQERGRVALVVAADEILWVAGLRPCEPLRVHPGSLRRLRLALSSG